MSLALTQPAAGLTFGPSTVAASASTDIAAGVVVTIDLSDLAAATPSVTASIAASSSAGLYGVVTKAISASKDGIVQLSGLATVTASEAVAEGALVSVVATSGKVETADTGEFVVGVACTAAAADGDEITVLLCGAPTVVAAD